MNELGSAPRMDEEIERQAWVISQLKVLLFILMLLLILIIMIIINANVDNRK